MCSKPSSARAEKGGSVCYSPLTTCTRKRKGTSRRQETPPVSLGPHYTVLLFDTPTQPTRICGTFCPEDVSVLRVPQGIHLVRLRQAFANREMCHYEWQGATCVYRTTLLPFADSVGQAVQVMSITRDISEWKEQERSVWLREGSKPKTFAQLLLAARENEKREIAKALHDEIGAASVMIAACTNVTKQAIEQRNTNRALKALEHLYGQMQASMQRLHHMVVSLRPPSLECGGSLRGHLENLVEEMCRLGKIEHRFVCPARLSEKGVSEQVRILLYRLVQEALTNVLKHAHASLVVVTLKRVQDEFVLTICDNGCGFVRQKSRPLNHIGMRSMQDSVRLLGGRFTISSAPGKGTKIGVVCPCVIYEGNG